MASKMGAFVANSGTSPEKKRFPMSGPTLPISQETHAGKYRGPGESFRESCNRVATALQDDPKHFRALRDILLDMRFMPGGRVQAAMGSTRRVTAYNCFVSGTIEDSAVDGHGSIMSRATEAFRTMRLGGGIGYDFSTLRPRDSLIKKLQSKASGPVSFMGIYDAVCRTVASAGHRRGAQMGVLRIDHPDIEEFIHAKQDEERFRGFNFSIAVTDRFMRALTSGEKEFPLRFGGQTYKTVHPEDLWEMIMRSTWDWAEPGVLFIDTINDWNNLYYCEDIAATNPCGEQPLPPYGACLLGSFALPKYLYKEGTRWHFDWDQLGRDIPHVVRGMDNVVDRTDYPLQEQEKEAQSKRRMGIGVTGMANCIEALGFSYGSEGALQYVNDILWRINRDCYKASIALAEEKGPFPLFGEEYLIGKFIQAKFGEDEAMMDDLHRHGIRNSHLTSIAPTGTISLCNDNMSSGIEPVFAYEYERTIIGEDGAERETIPDYGKRVLGVEGKVASEVTIQEHLAMLSTAQSNVDSAVSKTCNVPADMEWDAFKNTYIDAWKMGCKGLTTFNTGGKREGILVETTKEEQKDEPAPACRIDLETGRRECD